VHAPALRADVPPAIHTEELQRLARVSVVLCMSLERVILKSSFKAFAEILNSERTVFWNPFFGLH
jgi:hypothetical protein